MSDAIRDTYIDALVERCEQQMAREGWLDPDFDSSNSEQLPSYQTCNDIDRSLRSLYQLLGYQTSLSKDGFTVLEHNLSFVPIVHDELLLDGLIEDGAVRFKFGEATEMFIGYVGILPLFDEKTGDDEPPYAGPFLYGRSCINVTFQDTQYMSPYAYIRLRGMGVAESYRPFRMN